MENIVTLQLYRKIEDKIKVVTSFIIGNNIKNVSDKYLNKILNDGCQKYDINLSFYYGYRIVYSTCNNYDEVVESITLREIRE